MSLASSSRTRSRPSFWAFLILGLAVVPGLLGPVAYGASSWKISGAGILLAFFSFGLWMMLRPAHWGAWRRPAGFDALALWCGWLVLVSLFYAPYPQASVQAILTAASCLGAGWVVADISSRSRRVGMILLAFFMIVICLESAYAIVQHFQKSRTILFVPRIAMYQQRASGTYFNPNLFAHLLAIGTAFSIGVLFWKPGGGGVRILAAGTILLAIPGILLSFSRTGMIAVVVGGGVSLMALLFSAHTQIRRRVLVALACLLLLGIGLFFLFPGIRDRWTGDLLRRDARLQIWQDCIGMVAQHPAWGWGIGMFEDVAALNRVKYLDYWFTLNHAHNEVLEVAVEQGFEGLLVLFAAVLLLLRSGRYMLRSAAERGEQGIVAGMLGAIAATAAHAMFDFNLHGFANNHAMVLLLAIAGARVNPYPAPIEKGRRSPSRYGKGLAATVSILAMIPAWMIWRGAFYQEMASYYLDTAAYDPPRAFKALEQGRKIDPMNPYFPLSLGRLTVDRAWWAKEEEESRRLMDEAEAWVNRAEKLRPLAPQIDTRRIDIFELRGDLNAALEYARTVAERRSTSVPALVDVGHILRSMERYQEAMDAYVAAWLRSGGREEWIRAFIKEMKARLETPLPQSTQDP